METAAEIMETSADREQTVAGTEAFNLMLGIFLALKRMFESVAVRLQGWKTRLGFRVFEL